MRNRALVRGRSAAGIAASAALPLTTPNDFLSRSGAPTGASKGSSSHYDLLVPSNQSKPDRAETAYRSHRDQIYWFFLRRTGDHHEAEELTQRVFADATAAFKRSDFEPASMLSWLLVVAERRLLDDVRRRITARRGLRLLSHAEEAPDTVHSRQIAIALRESIRRLPEGQRHVVVMKVMEGRPFAEIAAKLGTSEAACKMRMSRAISQIKEDLTREGVRYRDD
jgi:RNA polymerase sigma-70 factor, ECF subfamily